MTYDDPNIFYLSIHRGGGGEWEKNPNNYFYPGTGSPDETGGGTYGTGTNLNIAWGRGSMSNVEYAAAFSEVVLPVLKSFEPDLILVACGFDAAAGDLLGDCGLTPEMFYIMTRALISAGEDVPMVVVLEGGYNLNVLSDCMEATALALLDEPWKGDVTTERDVESSLSRFWRHEMMQQASPTYASDTESGSSNGGGGDYCYHAQQRQQETRTKATLQAIASIRSSARNLALSQTWLGAFSCIRSPLNSNTKTVCTGNHYRHGPHHDDDDLAGGKIVTVCNCKKRYLNRLKMLDHDRYPTKKPMLVRFAPSESRHAPYNTGAA